MTDVTVKIVKAPLPKPRNTWGARIEALKSGEALQVTGDRKARERARAGVSNWARKSKNWAVITRTDGDTLTIWKVPKDRPMKDNGPATKTKK